MEVMAMIPRRNCLWDEDIIERYSMGSLSEDEAAGFEAHLLVCESCQAKLTEQDAIRSHIQGAAALQREDFRTRERGIRLFPGLFPALAGLAIVLVLAGVALRWIRPDTAAPAFALKLEAMRGSAPGGQAPSGRPLQVQADLSGLPAAAYRLELVDRDGAALWKGVAPAAKLPALRPGSYFMRVFTANGQLVREYGLEVDAPAAH